MHRKPVILFLLLLLTACSRQEAEQPTSILRHSGEVDAVSLTIDIFADGMAEITASVHVARNTPARRAMETLFQVEGGGPTGAFIIGIAGIRAETTRKQFWHLAIDGQPAQTGIDEVIISRPMRITWTLKTW